MKTLNVIRVLIAVACAAWIVTDAAAQRYLTNSGPWTTANNWSPVGVPSGADTRVGQGAVGSLKTGTVTISSGDSVSASTLYLGVDGTDTHGTVNISGGTLTISGHLQAGWSGTGTVVQTGGTVDVNHVRLGESGGASGNYQLSGNNSLLKAGQIYVGTLANINSTNSFTMTSGVISNSGNLHIAHQGVGSFTQTGGTNVMNQLRMNDGAQGNGSLTVSGANTLFKTSGDFYTAIGGNSTNTITISGGTLQLGGVYQLSLSGNGRTIVTQSAGRVTVAGQFRAGENGGAVYNLSGGELIVSGANSYIGLFNASRSTTMTQSGGTATFQTVQIGINQTANYNLNGGQLNALQIDKSSSGSLNLNGGTLTAGTITFNVVNNGSTISPGTNNVTGRTTINGTYSTTAGSLAIKIGGTTAATAYQDTPSKYANISATGAITLGGNLKPSLINSFTPTFSDTFTIATGSSVSGTFGNTATANGGGVRVALPDGLASFKVTYNAASVVLGDYLSDNEWQASSGGNWAAAGAASWTALDPNGSAYIAKFGDAPSGSGALTANLDANRTVQGILFTSANHQYTISGANTLTLDNTGNSAAAFITASGSSRTNTISTPVALNSDLNVAASLSDALLTMSGPISGAGRSVSKSGPGTLRLSGTNTYTGGTVVNAGTLIVDGRVLGNVNLAASATQLGGHGLIAGNVSGSGTVSPGNSPGILTIGSLTPGSLTFDFEFTANNPDYTNPLNSLNDVLRITNATPFTANLTAANTVNLYVTMTLTPGVTNVFRGGFYTDRSASFNAEITNAIYNVILNGSPYGAPLYVTTVNAPAFSQNGYVMEFGILGGPLALVPEPSTTLLLGVGGALLYRRLRRK